MQKKFYPASQISRSLDPSQKGFTTVVGRHDRRLTDADINLLQDVQDAKVKAILDNTLFSGVTSYKPFVFHDNVENTFTIPAFEVLFNGDIVTIGGFKSYDLGSNRVTIPKPSFWTYGQSLDNEMKIFVVYLELWYRHLDPESGEGYWVDPADGTRFFYPNGCIDTPKANLIADDVYDPFDQINTTSRVQIQWALRVAQLPWSYDFDRLRFGLDKGPNVNEVVYAQAFQPQVVPLQDYSFTNMGSINGDFGLWRAGVSSALSSLRTLDGYSYAMPLAVLSQRNAGPYSIDENPFGCMDRSTPNSGLLGFGVSGRPDGKFADVIYPDDVIDTRLVTQIKDADPEELLNRGFSDLVMGKSSLKVSRGDGVGCRADALGALLPYTIHAGPTPHTNSAYIGKFNGFVNGFSSDEHQNSTSVIVTIGEKADGFSGQRWSLNDSFSLAINEGPETIQSVTVQSLVKGSDGSLTPVLLFTGQIEVTGLGTASVLVKLSMNPLGTNWDPEDRPLCVSVTSATPAGSDMNLKVVPKTLCGGELNDPVSGTFRAFGVSEYEIQNTRTRESLVVYNPSYSSAIFGTHGLVRVPSSSGTQSVENGQTVTTFTLNKTIGKLTGVYVFSALDLVNNQEVPIIRRKISGEAMVVTVARSFSSATYLQFQVVCERTAQIGYNAPIKGVLAIEETVFVGTSTYKVTDPRVLILNSTFSSATGNRILLGSDHGVLKGIGGDPQGNKLVFVKNGSDYQAYTLSDVQIFEGVATLLLPDASVNLTTTEWFLVASLLPSFDSNASISLMSYYVPYQGEGVEGREYSVIYSEDTAIITTNGTGTKPVIGLRDVFPFDRELPLSVSLPAQPTWQDSDLANQPVEVASDRNYEAKRLSNVSHTLQVPLHTNDFIEPLTGWKRKRISFSIKGSRGFAKAFPHVGFAVRKPQSRSVLGNAVMATSAPVSLYVNNVNGLDSNDGLTALTPKKTIQGALSVVPSVIRHPVTVHLMVTGVDYNLGAMQALGQIQAAVIGDGKVRPIKHYCIANLSYEIQGSGRLLITREIGKVDPIVITASGYTPVGDGSLSAFVVDGSRVIFNGLRFTGFGIDVNTNPAVKGLDANIEFVDCRWDNNIQAGSFESGSSIILNNCSVSVPGGGTGMVLSGSNLSSVNTSLTATAGSGPFYIAERNSGVTLREHTIQDETGVTESTTIVLAKINSSVSCSTDFSTRGKAVVTMNSILTRPVSNRPFLGEVSVDSTSSVITDTV
jgi:hypothetical protein